MSTSKPELSEISHFYAGKNVLVTGATGFMGKVLVEKLLRACEDVSTIYILVRTKKGVSPIQRHGDYIKHLIFEKIRAKNPEILKKIKVVKGDLSIDKLGLDEIDENKLIDNVDIIIHIAANVRFDLSLRDAIGFNTVGTYRVLQLAERIKNLQVLTHVSTAYCHCNEDVVEEKYYPSAENPYGIMEMVKLLNKDIIDDITPKLLQGLPNTYALTKSLTEDLVHSYANKIPIAICRPSIVTAAWKEPYEGWVEGTNGATGLMIGACKGVIRSMHCNPDYASESVPVDFAINAIIALTQKRAQMNSNKVYYVNISDSGINPITWGDSIERGRLLSYEYPISNQILWFPNGSVKSNYLHHQFCVMFFHYLPAYIIDFFLLIARQKPFLVNVQKRVSQGLKVLQYYTTKEWVFKNDNLLKLYDDLNETDKKRFNFDFRQVDLDIYLKNYIMGIRTYLLKEKPEDLPKARSIVKKLYYLDKFVSIIFYGIVFYFLFFHFGSILGFFQSFFEGSFLLVARRQ